DSKCCKSVISIADSQLLPEDLDCITSWSKESKLTFNTKKTFLVRFHRPKYQTLVSLLKTPQTVELPPSIKCGQVSQFD
uniref:Uncharacterized protein n=1 Tax=Amphimedon queenslandica TaxID=400682 RepID=A0A1X7VBL8_AMPQE